MEYKKIEPNNNMYFTKIDVNKIRSGAIRMGGERCVLDDVIEKRRVFLATPLLILTRCMEHKKTFNIIFIASSSIYYLVNDI